MIWVLYLVVGAGAGLLAGLLGVGGGLVIVPALVWLLPLHGTQASLLMHLAVGTSLATIVATGASSTAAHARRGAVDWLLFSRLTPGILLGAAAGALTAQRLPSDTLRMLFGVFEVGAGLQLAVGRAPSVPHPRPRAGTLALAGILIGAVSTLLGIGGGTLTVPYLLWCSVPMRQAVATAAACGVPIALAGATAFVLLGWEAPGLPVGATGYVFWPAAGIVGLASVLAAPFGAALAHRVPVLALQRVFAALLVVLGLRLLADG